MHKSAQILHAEGVVSSFGPVRGELPAHFSR
jgi:hypothetical protein